MAAVTQGPLKDFLSTRRKRTKVIGHVDRHLQTRVPDTSRPTDVLHPSDMVSKDWCLRASYHLLRGAEPRRFSHPLRTENVFRTGHDIHEKWQGWLADAGVLYGDYKCVVCASEGARVVSTSLGYPEHPCGACGYLLWKYDEMKMEIPQLRVSGHTDGGLIWGGIDPLFSEQAPEQLLEIKSVGTGTLRVYEPSLLRAGCLEEAFKNISRPFGGHNLQVQLYLEAQRVKFGDRAPTSAIILYECKANQDTKEFEIERNRDLIEEILDKAYEVVQSVEAGQEPDCTNHPGSTCAKCKEF